MAAAEAPRFDFSTALKLLNDGRRVARAGWNGWKSGKAFAVVKQKGYPDGIAINANTQEALDLPEGTVVKFAPYLMLCVATLKEDSNEVKDRVALPWTPSQQDQLETDWIEVP